VPEKEETRSDLAWHITPGVLELAEVSFHTLLRKPGVDDVGEEGDPDSNLSPTPCAESLKVARS